jgi:hypothetical protein
VASHVHSDWSYDGRWPLRRIAEEFGRRGYQAVLLAEHDRGFDDTRWEALRQACIAASRPTCVLVPGIEYSDPTNSIHVPVWGRLPFLGEGLDTGVMLEQAHQLGGLAVLAHPARRDAWERFDSAWLSRLLGVEVWNRKYDGYAPNRQVAQLLARRPELLAFASLDFHTERQFHPLAMTVEIDGDIGEAAICEALRARRARAMAFGVPALSLAAGPVWPAIRGLERARRRIAPHVRRGAHLRRVVGARGRRD